LGLKGLIVVVVVVVVVVMYQGPTWTTSQFSLEGCSVKTKCTNYPAIDAVSWRYVE
jgi:hypothetical protein